MAVVMNNVGSNPDQVNQYYSDGVRGLGCIYYEHYNVISTKHYKKSAFYFLLQSVACNLFYTKYARSTCMHKIYQMYSFKNTIRVLDYLMSDLLLLK